MKVLELYSGIGGMHLSLKYSEVKGEIKAAVDINSVANSVYQHNFPNVKLFNKNIQGFTAEFIHKLDVDTILMSPPCQPFTRNGLQKDVEDERTNSFLHILNLLPNLRIQRLLIENVKGFETSKMRERLLETLRKCGFHYQEFVLNPKKFGVPNSRTRYYCIARKDPFQFQTDILMHDLPVTGQENSADNTTTIDNFIEDGDLSDFYLQDKHLIKYLNILDICYLDSISTCCFTKAYGRYLEGTGSVFTENSQEFVGKLIAEISEISKDDDNFLRKARMLKLRFFTPKEVSRLMCFPNDFKFPDTTTNRQRYMVLGNSINVKVVGELIKLL